MSRARLVAAVVAAMFLGAVVAGLGGRTRQISVEIWLAVATAALAWVIAERATTVAPVRDDRSGRRFRNRANPLPEDRPRALANLEGLLANAGTSSRAASLRLRPRLAAAASELLRTRHGIDLAADPERAAAVLGPEIWLLDDGPLPRSPTPGEVERLLVRALGPTDDNPTTSGDQP